MSELTFRTALAIGFVLLAVVRVYYFRLTGTMADSVSTEGRGLQWLRAAFGGPALGSIALYLLNPSWMAWSAVHLPEWLRWSGAGIGLAGLALLVWVHRMLGSNFSHTLVVRSNHALIKTGPYRWVRHPMYTSFVLMFGAAVLLMANWFTGATGAAALGVVLVLRLRREEAMLVQKFGGEYTAYARQTGRFLPRLLGR